MTMKNELRSKFKQLRKNMSVDEAFEKSIMAQKHFLKTEIYKKSRCIMLYKALGNEVNTEMLLARAFADGKKVVLPVTDVENGKITPFYTNINATYEKGGFSVREPQNTVEAKIEEIDVVVVPGIAFDCKGNRIGFGKGCYDMFLEKCNAVSVGLCYEFQLIPEIPADTGDVKMDYILTENEFFSV